ncbi:MAG: hypothetical protein WCK06_09980 [Actinomycetota bacterium]
MALERHPALILAAIMLLAWAFEVRFTTKMTQFEPDEIGYSRIAINMAETLRPVALDAVGRSRLNQLYPLLIAPLYRAFGNVDAYHAVRLLNPALIAASALPTFFLARLLGLRRAVGYALAAVVVVLPWTTMASVELTEVVAFPAFLLSVLLITRAVVRPSVGNDLLALASITLASFARLQLVVLVVVLPLAILINALAFRDGLSLQSLARRVARRHYAICIVFAAGVLVIAVLAAAGRLVPALGFYGNTVQGSSFLPAGTWQMIRANFVALALGLGFMPVALAVGGWLVQLLRPSNKAAHAFALVSVMASILILVQVASINVRFTGLVVQERYVMFLAPLFAIGMATSIRYTPRLGLGAGVGIALVGLLVVTETIIPQTSSFWFLVSPGLSTAAESTGPAISNLVGQFGEHRFAALALVGTAITLLIVFVRGRQGLAPALALALIVAFVWNIWSTNYAFNKVLEEMGRGSIAKAGWVDRAVSGSAPVTVLATQSGPVPSARETWWGVEFWNRNVSRVLSLSSSQTTWHGPVAPEIDSGSGVVSNSGGADYLVAAAAGVPAAPQGKVLATSPNGRLQLFRVSQPVRLKWFVTGISDDGWLPQAGKASFRVFDTGGGASCHLRLTFSLPSALPEARTVIASRGSWRRVVAIRPGASASTSVPDCRPSDQIGDVRLTVVASSGALAAVTPQLRRIEVEPR